MAFKKKTVKEWREELESGLKFRNDYGLESQWGILEGMFYNTSISDDGGKHKTGPGPNLILSTGDALVSALSISYPRITVKARKPEFVPGAMILEGLDNWFLRELEIPETIETVELHAYLWGRGVVKIGYDSKYGYGGDVDPEGTGLTFGQFDSKGNRIEIGVNPGMPWVEAALPHDVIVPFGTTSDKNAWYFAHRIIRHIEDVRSDSKYKSKGLRSSLSRADFMDSYKTRQKDRRSVEEIVSGSSGSKQNDDHEFSYVELFEIHDQRTGRVYVIASGYDSFLRDEKDDLQLDGLPFVGLSFVPRARSFWTTPDAYYLIQAQAEMNDISLITSKQRRISLLKFLYHKGAIEEEEMIKAMSAEVGIGIGVDDGVSLKESIQAFTVFNNNSQQYQDGEWVRRNARELVGFSRNQMGEYEQTGRRTAHEVESVQQGSQKRLGRRQNAVRKMYVDIIKKLNQIVFSFWRDEMIQEVLGEDGLKHWIRFRGEQLKGEYQYEVNFSSEVIPSENNRKMEALQLYGSLSNDPLVDPRALRDYLKDAFNDPSLERVFGMDDIGGGNTGGDVKGSENANLSI